MFWYRFLFNWFSKPLIYQSDNSIFAVHQQCLHRSSFGVLLPCDTQRPLPPNSALVLRLADLLRLSPRIRSPGAIRDNSRRVPSVCDAALDSGFANEPKDVVPRLTERFSASKEVYRAARMGRAGR